MTGNGSIATKPMETMHDPVHPGEILREELEARGTTITGAARALGVTRKALSDVVNLKAPRAGGSRGNGSLLRASTSAPEGRGRDSRSIANARAVLGVASPSPEPV